MGTGRASKQGSCPCLPTSEMGWIKSGVKGPFTEGSRVLRSISMIWS